MQALQTLVSILLLSELRLDLIKLHLQLGTLILHQFQLFKELFILLLVASYNLVLFR